MVGAAAISFAVNLRIRSEDDDPPALVLVAAVAADDDACTSEMLRLPLDEDDEDDDDDCCCCFCFFLLSGMLNAFPPINSASKAALFFVRKVADSGLVSKGHER
jgi:hypothetical protein